MANNNVQTTVTVGMDVNLAKRNAEALKQVIVDLKAQLKEARAAMDTAVSADAFKRAGEAVDNLILKIHTLEKVQRSATPAAAYESFISGDTMNSNTLRQAQRGAKNRLNTVNEFAGDKEARKFLDDIDRTQMRLNRLQAGFTNPLQAVRRELNDLSGGELKRLHTLLQQEQVLVKGNESAWSAYSAAIAKVDERIREYDTLARQQMGASILSQSQRNGFAQANERDINRAIEKLREYRTVINDPNGAGKATWEATTREILKLQATLDTLKQKTAEMKGEAMSLTSAYRAGLQAGNGTFKGSTQQLELAKKTLQDQLALVERGSKQYNQLQKAIQGCEMEEKRMGMTAKEVQAVLDKPKGKSYNELKIAVEQGRMALAKMRTETDADKKKFDELAAKVKECDIQMKQLAGSAKGTASAWDKAWGRLKTYIGLYMGAAVAMQKLAGTMGDLMELSDKMGEVRKTTGFTADEVGHLSDSLKKLDTRTTITGLLDLSVAAGQLGLKTQEDVEGFTIAANKLMVALPEMGKEGATEMLKVALATGEIDKIRKQMEEGLIEGSSATAVAMEKVGSTIDRLRATSAATAPAITDFVKRVGAVGAQSGITIDQVAALGSTVDALGMRVEMSATALSRMIPAIKNNAFAIGQVIGKTEEYIKKQFAEGKGMNVILDIFDAINKSGKKSADDIEAMFGGSMKEIMKELNQQGARAGIVFAGLSQNVNELRRQLGVAAEAYKENIAIQNEYNKMNETTAAKWERLKNEVEEMFVGDQAQRWLGAIIDGLRSLVNFISGNVKPSLEWLSTAVKTFLVAWATFKIGLGEGVLYKLVAGIKSLGQSIALTAMYTKDYIVLKWQLVRAHDEEAKAAIRAKMAQKSLNKEMMANVWMAVVAAVGYLVLKIYDYIKASKEAAAEAGRFNQKVYEEQQALHNLFGPLNKSNMAQEERSKLISEINSKYGKYLGYMLSETTSAVQLAEAHALIAKRIREEAYERRIAEKERSIQEAHSEDVNAAYTKISDRLRGSVKGSADVQAIADMLKGIVDSRISEIKYAYDDSENIFKARTNYYIDPKIKAAIDNGIERLIVDGKLSRDNVGLIQKAVYKYTVEAKSQHDDIMKQTSNVRSDLRNIQGAIQTDLTRSLNGLVGNIINFAKQQQNKPAFAPAPGPWAPQPQGNNALRPFWQQGNSNTGTGWTGGWGTGGQQQTQTIQKAPAGWKPQINEKNVEEVRQFVKNQDDLRGAIKANAEDMSSDMRDIYESYLVSDKEMNRLRKLIADEDRKNNTGGGNPYGNFTVMDSYDKWSADALVDRKKQMLQYVRALANGADVQAVLSQDKKFIDEATRKGIKNVRDAIEWYNSERLKIQEELADRHLTNEGNWANPSKAKGRRNRMPMAESAIAELERYYQWRKEVIEEKRAEEGMSEAEYNRRLEALEMEHLQKRSDLRKSYITEDKKFVTQFRDWWKSVRELDAVEWELIEAEVKVATERDRKYIGMNAQKDLTSMNAIVVKQLKAIEDIINKERPFNGITDNLEENLTKMRILFADFDQQKAEALKRGASKEELDRIDASADAQRMSRLSELLGLSEDAYTLTVEELMKRMGDAGMQSLVDALNSNENGEKMKRALLAQLHSTYDAVQDAIRKEASQIKKQVDIAWKDALMPDGSSLKGAYEKAISALGLEQDRVQRANQLIGAGAASERVADKLAIKQLQVRLAMQQHYYNLIKAKGQDHIKKLEQEVELLEKQGELEQAAIKRLDVKHAKTALAISDAEEMTKVMEQQNAIANQLEESQNRLYKELREWGDLLASSVQSVMEASNAGNAEYYNERAKLDLTGKGGPGAGTYIVIDNEGTSDAKAHYEYLDERAALERQHEIEQQNAQAEAWKKVMDDINMKMSDMITDQMNALLQNASIDANTKEVDLNTQALIKNTAAISKDMKVKVTTAPATETKTPATTGSEFANDKQANYPSGGSQVIAAQSNVDFATDKGANYPSGENAPAPSTDVEAQNANTQAVVGLTQAIVGMSDKQANYPGTENPTPEGQTLFESTGDFAGDKMAYYQAIGEQAQQAKEAEILASQESTDAQINDIERLKQAKIDASNQSTQVVTDNSNKEQQTTKENDNKERKSTSNKFAAMAAACNMYGIAYQTMSNDNLDTFQKFQLFALQAAGQTAIAMLTTDMLKTDAEGKIELPGILGKAASQLGPIAGPIAFAAMTALLGGLMGMAVSKVAKSKSQISQVTGASVSAGRLATGMLTYAEGNVNEFTDPSSLTPGRQYNVDGADGKTYRARYMGKGAKTHITNGPEFHLVGEKGQEAIIDAHTTRNIQINEPEIWHTIQTLYNGGRITNSRVRRGRGMAAFAEGNLNEFEEMGAMGDMGTMKGIGLEEVTALRTSLDRQNELWERILAEGIHANFDVYGKGGLVDSYDTGKKNVTRHGERY